MAKHYKYVNGKKMVVINNYDLGSDVIPEEMELIPDITAADAGKVLTADSNGEPVWDTVPKELPSVAGNAGKVLTVNSGATGTEWKDAPSGLPAVTIDDAGDVLTVNASGEWEAAAPSGGGTVVNATWSYDTEGEQPSAILSVPADITLPCIISIPPASLPTGWVLDDSAAPGDQLLTFGGDYVPFFHVPNALSIAHVMMSNINGFMFSLVGQVLSYYIPIDNGSVGN